MLVSRAGLTIVGIAKSSKLSDNESFLSTARAYAD